MPPILWEKVNLVVFFPLSATYAFWFIGVTPLSEFQYSRYYGKEKLPLHIWLGVSVENQDYVKRIPHLQETPAQIRFLSIEPLLGPVCLDAWALRGIHWVIVCGESGWGARPMNPEWARNIRRQCEKHKVAFFFKQWGAHDPQGKRVGKKAAGRLLDGKTWNEMPATTVA